MLVAAALPGSGVRTHKTKRRLQAGSGTQPEKLLSPHNAVLL